MSGNIVTAACLGACRSVVVGSESVDPRLSMYCIHCHSVGPGRGYLTLSNRKKDIALGTVDLSACLEAEAQMYTIANRAGN